MCTVHSIDSDGAACYLQHKLKRKGKLAESPHCAPHLPPAQADSQSSNMQHLHSDLKHDGESEGSWMHRATDCGRDNVGGDVS